MGFRNTNVPVNATANEIVADVLTETAGTDAIIVGSPVQLYFNASGVLCGRSGVVDGSSRNGRWGIALEASSSNTATIKVVKRGTATVAGGGTAGRQVTAIAASGGVTDAATASGNADLSLAYVVDATTIVIY